MRLSKIVIAIDGYSACGKSTTAKEVAAILGHRYIDTTFIYAKADLKSLREVAMPWPKKR